MSVLGQRLDQARSALERLQHIPADCLSERLDPPLSAAQIERHREPKRSAIGVDGSPEEAVVVRDLDPAPEVWRQLSRGLALQLRPRLVRESQD
jgi:hypothetical protein